MGEEGKGEGIKNMNATALCFYHILDGFSAIPSAHCLALVIETAPPPTPSPSLWRPDDAIWTQTLKYPPSVVRILPF